MADANMRIIISAVNQTQGAFQQIKDDLNGLKSSASGYSDVTKTATESTKSFSLSLATIGKVAAGVIATYAAIKKAFDFTEEGASMLTTIQTATSIAASYGQNMQEIVKSVRAASLDTVTEYDATLAVSQALMFGLQGDAEQFGNLMEIAAFRGRAFGMSATQAFSDIVRGIGRLSPLILDNIGITIDAENTYKAYAESIGKAASELSSVEKRQALLNRVIEEGNILMQEAGGLTYSAATAFERISAKWNNFWNQVKEGTAEAILPLLSTEEEITGYYDNIDTNLKKASQSYDEYLKNRKRQLEAQGYYVSEEGDLYKRSFQSLVMAGRLGALQLRQELVTKDVFLSEEEYKIKQWQIAVGMGATGTASIGATPAQIAQEEEYADAIDSVSHAFEAQIGIVGELSRMQETYFANMRKSKTATDELSDSVNEYIYETAAATGLLGENATIKLAFALDQIDIKSYTTAEAVQYLTQAFDLNGSGMIDTMGEATALSGALVQLTANANAALQDRSAVWSITMLLNGIELPWGGLEDSGYTPITPDVPLSVLPKLTIPPRAGGGVVNSGSPYIVGEAGPELFIPQDNGRIVSNGNFGVGGKNVTINIKYAPTISTASESEVQWVLKPMIQRALREA